MNVSLFPRRAVTLVVLVVALACALGACKKKVTPPSAIPTLTSVSVTPNSVTGGTSVTGTVTMSAAVTVAISVALQSNSGSVSVPGTVSIPGGATSATFTATTTAVSASTPAAITATFGGNTQTASLTVLPGLAANFSVRSLSPSIRKTSNSDPGTVVLPTDTVDACPLVNTQFDCVFNGSASTATTASPIQTYIWTYAAGSQAPVTETSSTPTYKPAASGCGFFGGQTATTAGGLTFISMRVDLQVQDTAGNKSAVKTTQNVRVFPANQCGGGF